MNIYILNATLNGKLLSEILCEKLKIKGLITLDESASSQTNEYYDYTEFCKERGVECIKLSSYGSLSENERSMIECLDMDLVIVASWQRLVPDWFINKCSIGVIGAHGSHAGITMGRGRSPQNWALMLGQRNFDLSIFWIEPGVDNGAVIDSRKFEYSDTDDILVSYVKINLCKAEMILDNINNGRISRKEGTPQSVEGYYLPQRKKEDGMIDWNRSADDIYNMVRALTKPYPGAFTVYANNEFKIWSAKPVHLKDCRIYDGAKNGTVLSILGESILVKCKEDLLLIEEMTGMDLIRAGIVFKSADYKEQMRTIVDRHKSKYSTPLSELIMNELEDQQL